jgi:uncharacterized protein with HEPN domain
MGLDAVVKAKRSEILRLAAQHGARNVRVFGSLARGQADPDSDLDLLVEMDEGRSLLGLVGLWQDLEDGVYLQHIRDAIHQIRSYTQEGKDPFLADRKSQDATIRNLEIIGEAVKKLSPRLRSTHPDVPWKRIAGMRDKMIHDYFGIDHFEESLSHLPSA